MIFDSFVFFKCVFFLVLFVFVWGDLLRIVHLFLDFFKCFLVICYFLSISLFIRFFYYLLNFVFLNCWIHLFKGFVLFVCECCIFFSFLKG